MDDVPIRTHVLRSIGIEGMSSGGSLFRRALLRPVDRKTTGVLSPKSFSTLLLSTWNETRRRLALVLPPTKYEVHFFIWRLDLLP